MTFDYRTKGTCSQLIHLDVEGDVLTNVWFEGGCSGNLQGISALVKGMRIDDVIAHLSGIQCGFKGTSCPDQLSRALRAYKQTQQ